MIYLLSCLHTFVINAISGYRAPSNTLAVPVYDFIHISTSLSGDAGGLSVEVLRMQSSTGDADEASDRDSDSNEIVKEFNHINKRLAEEIHAKQAQSLSSLLSSAQAKDEEITEVLSDMDDDTLSSQISHEDGRNVLHYLTKYNGARVSILQTILKRAPSLANKALKTSGLLPLHILCRYFPNETQSLEILLQASPASAAMPEAEEKEKVRGRVCDDCCCGVVHCEWNTQACTSCILLAISALPPFLISFHPFARPAFALKLQDRMSSSPFCMRCWCVVKGNQSCQGARHRWLVASSLLCLQFECEMLKTTMTRRRSEGGKDWIVMMMMMLLLML
eukprot:766016-Hanusia_phi.AAC.4